LELSAVKNDKLILQKDLEKAKSDLSNSDALIDSLNQRLRTKEENSKMLENDILSLHNQVVSSKQKEADYKAKAG